MRPVASTTSPINAVCMTRNFCTVQTYVNFGIFLSSPIALMIVGFNDRRDQRSSGSMIFRINDCRAQCSSWPDDSDRTSPVPPDNSRRLLRYFIILPVFHDIPNATPDRIRDLPIESGRRLPRDIGGCGDDGLPESFDQVPAK